MKVGYWAMSKICRGGKTWSHILWGYLLCVEAHILGYYVTLFIPKIGSKIDCVVYTGLYYFMKEIPVYIDLQCYILDQSLCVCNPVMQLVHKPGV